MRTIQKLSFVMALAVGVLICGALQAEALPNPFDDRSPAVQNQDNRIFSDISTALEKQKKTLREEVKIDVWEGRVLLTGILDDPKDRGIATKTARAVKGVKAVYNHLQVASKKIVKMRKVGKGGQEIKKVMNDGAVRSQIKVRLFSEKASVKSANYKYRVVLGHSYVIGFARNANEKKDILQVIRKTHGVKAVTEYIKVMKKK